MNLLVTSEVADLSEAFAALIADVRPFPGVEAFVHREGSSRGKLGRTFGTRVRSFTRVSSLVYQETSGSGETFVALIATVRPLAGVGASVCSESPR